MPCVCEIQAQHHETNASRGYFRRLYKIPGTCRVLRRLQDTSQHNRPLSIADIEDVYDTVWLFISTAEDVVKMGRRNVTQLFVL